MPLGRRLSVEWRAERAEGAMALRAVEPTPEEVLAAAPALAAGYNDPHNAGMMANTVLFSEEEIVAHYAAMKAAGARPFLLYRGAALVGDADFRNLQGARGEFALLIAARAEQNQGMGTRFAILLQAVAFGALGLQRVVVTILPQNTASRRLFAKIGFEVDASPEARAFAESDLDVAMSLDAATFARRHAGALAEVVVRER